MLPEKNNKRKRKIKEHQLDEVPSIDGRIEKKQVFILVELLFLIMFVR